MKKITTSLLILICSSMMRSSAQSWLLNGNNGTSPANNFVGTKDNKALVFRTNNIERLRITSSGSLGIDLHSPVQKLDVNGNINLRQGFALYMQNHPVLHIDSVTANTFVGNGTAPRISGSFCTGVGFQALFSNTSGSWNTA